MAKKLDIASIRKIVGTGYPPPHDGPCRTRERQALGDAAGLTQFGVNLLRLAPGTWSSQRHWHTEEEEFVFIVAGEVVLVTDHGEETLRAGDCAGFKANDPNGHHLQNRSSREALLLEIGSRAAGEAVYYPDVDMEIRPGSDDFVHKDGTKY